MDWSARDHHDQAAIDAISTDGTRYVMDPTSAEAFGGEEHVTVMQNGDERTVNGIELRVISAYNLVRRPEPGSKFHPEMGDLSEADLAFVPINLPYTMPPEESVSCI